MIAQSTNRISRILDEFGEQLTVPSDEKPLSASYDVDRTTPEYRNIWKNADYLDADSLNDRDTRHRIASRARYETANNAYMSGMLQTHCNYLVGSGPKLRMETQNKPFNERIEAGWKTWANAVKLRRKLWTMSHAKIVDGETFAIAVTNPSVRNRVKLDLVLIEAEQCQTPAMWFDSANEVDGINFDAFGNPTSYEILEGHPGSENTARTFLDSRLVDAQFVMHWFRMTRPGQHRAVSELVSSLNVGAGSRRFREATIAAAETAADFSVVLKTLLNANTESDPITPFSDMEIQKRMMVALPMGWEAQQMKAEHPTANYAEFNRQQIQEQGRPKSIPVNVGQADSSQHNFASGKLDHQSWFAELRTDRLGCEENVLNKLFVLWWQESAMTDGLNGDQDMMPHGWDWPVLPVADERARASARNMDLTNGSTTLSRSYQENGLDFEEEINHMANDYGLPVDEMRTVLLNRTLGANSAAKPEVEDNSIEESTEVEDVDETTKETTPVGT